MHSMEKELAILKKEVTLQRNQGLAKEKELQQDIIGLEKQVEGLKKQQAALRSEKEMVDTKFSKMRDEFQVIQKVCFIFSPNCIIILRVVFLPC